MGTQLVPEMVEEFHTLTRLSAEEDFIEFCHCESFKTKIWFLVMPACVISFLRLTFMLEFATVHKYGH
jgi:hypothetical protein